MKNLVKTLTFAFAAFAALTVRPLVAAIDVGQLAPDFTLTDIDGKKHALSEFRGKTVVIEWNNPDCPIVKKHYDSDNLPKLQRDTTADGVVWLLVNSGAPGQQGADYSAADLKRWMKEHDAAATAYLRDQDGKVGHLYGAQTTPHMFIVDPKGTLVYQGAIDSISSAKKDDIAKATKELSDS